MLTAERGNTLGSGAALVTVLAVCTGVSYFARPESERPAPRPPRLATEPAPEQLLWLNRHDPGNINVADTPAISANGRFVAYQPERNGPIQLHLVDTATRTSHSTTAESATNPAVTPDGRYLAFTDAFSQAVLRYDVETQRTTLVAQQGSGTPSISPDGTLVAYESNASSTTKSIFLRDLAHQTVERISPPADDHCERPQLAGDGRFVFFQSRATTVVHPPLQRNRQIYVHDRVTRTTRCVSVSPQGRPGSGSASQACATPGGNIVAFASSETNLDPDQIYVRDLATGTTDLASQGAARFFQSQGAGEAASCQRPYLGADGRYLLFTAQACDARAERVRGQLFAFVLDRRTGVLKPICAAAGVGLSGDGRWCYLAARRPLHPADQNSKPDLYRVPNPHVQLD